MTLYGIPNCNTVKKATEWLKRHGVSFSFHDYKKQGITADKLQAWVKQAGWEKLVNKKGTTWRGLPANVQAGVTNDAAAIALMLDKPSVIKRPVVEAGDRLLVGFDEAEFATLS